MQYRQCELFEAQPDLVAVKPEDQWFDRKSVRIEPTTLANELVGFANADGGTLVIGVENNGSITGTNAYTARVNRLLQAATDFTALPVRHTAGFVSCTTSAGMPDRLLVFEIHPSDRLHRNHRNEVFKRIGDQTRRLTDDEVRELAFDKGERPFDGMPVPGATMADLDSAAIQAFASAIGAGSDTERALQARGLIVHRDDERFITWGALLLFGLAPQSFLPGSFLRILRYAGTEAQPGTRSNLVFDRRIEGSLPSQVASARQVMSNQLRQMTRLDDQSGLFVTVSEVPEFAWLEAIVNALTHRSYSLQGDHIRVTLFDDRLEVASPGRLPEPVRIDNIRRTRFSRNPRISRTLADLGLVQELNEGMRRLFEEMARAGLPEPSLQQTDAGFIVTLYNVSVSEQIFQERLLDLISPAFTEILDWLLDHDRITTNEAALMTRSSLPTVRRYLRMLEEARLLERIATSPTDPQAFWRPQTVLRHRWRSRKGGTDSLQGKEGSGEVYQFMLDLVSSSFVTVVDTLFSEGRITTGQAASLSGLSLPTVRRYLRVLSEAGYIQHRALSPRDPQAFWELSGSSASTAKASLES